MSDHNPVYCSFCGKSQREAEVMLAGPVLVFICDTCVDDAREQIAKIRADRKLIAEAVRCVFCLPDPVALKSRERA